MTRNKFIALILASPFGFVFTKVAKACGVNFGRKDEGADLIWEAKPYDDEILDIMEKTKTDPEYRDRLLGGLMIDWAKEKMGLAEDGYIREYNECNYKVRNYDYWFSAYNKKKDEYEYCYFSITNTGILQFGDSKRKEDLSVEQNIYKNRVREFLKKHREYTLEEIEPVIDRIDKNST